MTIYVKRLMEMLGERYGDLDAGRFAEKLFEIGVVDHTRCKVLVVRQFVEDAMKRGQKKIDAMWCAAENFSCSYEYVRKCMYYYTDVNMN